MCSAAGAGQPVQHRERRRAGRHQSSARSSYWPGSLRWRRPHASEAADGASGDHRLTDSAHAARRRGDAVGLLRACHPEPTVAVTADDHGAGRRPPGTPLGGVVLVGARAVLAGQLSIGWLNDSSTPRGTARSADRTSRSRPGRCPRATVGVATGAWPRPPACRCRCCPGWPAAAGAPGRGRLPAGLYDLGAEVDAGSRCCPTSCASACCRRSSCSRCPARRRRRGGCRRPARCSARGPTSPTCCPTSTTTRRPGCAACRTASAPPASRAAAAVLLLAATVVLAAGAPVPAAGWRSAVPRGGRAGARRRVPPGPAAGLAGAVPCGAGGGRARGGAAAGRGPGPGP